MASEPRIAPDGTWFVFSAPVGDVSHVFRQRVGGQNVSDLSKDSKADNYNPAISPDGDHIAFRSDRDGGGIYVMGATGESVRRVTDFGYHPAWSPDGTRLLLSSVFVANPADRTQMSEAWIVNVESGAKHRLELGPDAFQGAWSPHGQMLAFARLGPNNRRQLMTVPATGGTPKILFDVAAGGTIWTPTWSPDGRYIYFSSSASGVMNVGRIEVDEATGEASRGPEEVTRGVASSLSHPSLSQKGNRLLFQSYSSRSNIERVGLDQQGNTVGQPLPVTRGANAFIWPDVSPDGQSLVFCTALSRDVSENIYVSRADGSELRALTFDDAKRNRLPRWALSGKELFFYSTHSGSFAAWSIGAEGGGLHVLAEVPGRTVIYAVPSRTDHRIALRIDDSLVIFDGRQPFSEKSATPIARYPDDQNRAFWPYDWSPDGKYLAGSSSPPFSVVLLSLDSQSYERLVPGTHPRWLPDGKRLIFTEPTGALRLFDLQKKESKEVLSLKPDTLETPAISPDGKWLYFKRAAEDGAVWMAEL